MTAPKLTRATYLSRNVGDYPASTQLMGVTYEKVDDLRYGTNPHQTAAFYRPVGLRTVIGHMEVLKTGKSGLSQTNLEDVSYALNICKFFERPACACMKHVNPSGAAVAGPGDRVLDVYRKARDSDPRAAFGSVVAFNVPVDEETAREIMSTFVECVVAPGFAAEALRLFNDRETYALNKDIRILKSGDPRLLPKYVGEDVSGYRTVKVLADGCVVVADPLLTNVKTVDDLKPARGSSRYPSGWTRPGSSRRCKPASKTCAGFRWELGCS